uniref:Deoxycytidylate deaminase n=1 Tax=Kryptolebias marmoratus TaxID=37003 RepID=A0A3Q3AAS5_KRYMA
MSLYGKEVICKDTTLGEYFMAFARLAAEMSRDPNTQVGACIVKDGKIVGTGYNAMPNGCTDLPWSNDNPDWLQKKYAYVCHAELNAIVNKFSADVKGCTMYVTLFPCNECAKLIIQTGIAKVVYLSDKYHDKDEMKASKAMLKEAKVELRYTANKLFLFCFIHSFSVNGNRSIFKPKRSENPTYPCRSRGLHY